MTSPPPLEQGALTRACGRPVVLFASCGSTNREAARLAQDGAEHGTIVITERQTEGRGRQGRAWMSSEGQNLTFSMILRPRLPTAQAPLLCLGAAVAIAEVTDLGIKWPNDVLDDEGRKVCGVLAELVTVGPRLDAVILGVGLNVFQTEFPPELPNPGSLALLGRQGDRAALLGRLTREILTRAAELETNPGWVLEAWRQRARTLGRRVRVGETEGVAEDIREDGALLIRTPRGLKAVLTGDVELVGRL
jgi:BirA family biotin operon repressor/biotin-[acetyl-CoA-carboxylase] ligase